VLPRHGDDLPVEAVAAVATTAVQGAVAIVVFGVAQHELPPILGVLDVVSAAGSLLEAPDAALLYGVSRVVAECLAVAVVVLRPRRLEMVSEVHIRDGEVPVWPAHFRRGEK